MDRHGELLEHHPASDFGRRRIVTRVVAVVDAVVMVVDFPVGRHRREQFAIARLHELLMPFLP